MSLVEQSSSSQNNSNFVFRTFTSIPSAISQIFTFMKSCKSRVFSVLYIPRPLCNFCETIAHGFSAIAISVKTSLGFVEINTSSNSIASSSSVIDSNPVPPKLNPKTGTISGVLNNANILSTKNKQPVRRAGSVFGIKDDPRSEALKKLDENIPILKKPKQNSEEYKSARRRIVEAAIFLTNYHQNITLVWELILAEAGARNGTEEFMYYARFTEMREKTRDKKNSLDRVESNIAAIITHCIVEYTFGIIENECLIADEIAEGNPHSKLVQQANDMCADYRKAIESINKDPDAAKTEILTKCERGSQDLYLFTDQTLRNKKYEDATTVVNNYGTSNFGTNRFGTYVDSLRG